MTSGTGGTPGTCHDLDMIAAQSNVGHPRPAPRRGDGTSAREEILDAAAELFGQQGYAATSTRAIAKAVGIKQASLYYHFASKEQILAELLAGTVQPALAAAGTLAASTEPIEARLWAMTAFDVRQQVCGRWNPGALRLMPELRAPRITAFHAQRQRLRTAYRQLIAQGCTDGVFSCDDVPLVTDLVLGLVGSVPPARMDRARPDPGRLAATVADGCLRLLALPGRRAAVTRRRGERLLATL